MEIQDIIDQVTNRVTLFCTERELDSELFEIVFDPPYNPFRVVLIVKYNVLLIGQTAGIFVRHIFDLIEDIDTFIADFDAVISATNLGIEPISVIELVSNTTINAPGSTGFSTYVSIGLTFNRM